MLQRNDTEAVLWVADAGQLLGPNETVDLELVVPGCVPVAESDSPAPKRGSKSAAAAAAAEPPAADPDPPAAAEPAPPAEPETPEPVAQPGDAGEPAKETAP